MPPPTHTHKVVEPHNTQKHHTAMPICNQAHTNAKAVECQASAISPTLASTNPTTTPSTTNNKQEGRRKKDEWWHKATSAHVHKSKPNTMATWLAALVLSKCHQSWSPQPHTTIHNHNQCVWFWRKHRDSLTTATNHGHHTLPSPWCGLAVLCVCVSQMASVWHHGHSVATSIKPPLMPHTEREREAWMEQERQWRVRAQQMVWKWLAKQASHKHHNNDCAQTTVTK